MYDIQTYCTDDGVEPYVTWLGALPHRQAKAQIVVRSVTNAEIEMTAKNGRSHDEVVEMLRADPEFADAYLAATLEETDQPGGHQAMLTALRHIA